MISPSVEPLELFFFFLSNRDSPLRMRLKSDLLLAVRCSQGRHRGHSLAWMSTSLKAWARPVSARALHYT